MERKAIISLLFLILIVIMAGCASMESFGHKYMMRGQILDITDGVAYLCIGSMDGAEVGQEYTVYTFERTTNPNPKYAAQPYFVKKKAGKIRITEIVDEHMATAKILAGQVKVNDVAELE
jgi:spermidine/putrescine-binding protein